MRRIALLASTFIALQSFVALPVTVARAEDKVVDCKNGDLNDMEILQCEADKYAVADKELNDVYKQARDLIKTFDDDQKGGEKAFVSGQKKWIGYRDDYCEAYGYQAHGGTLEPIYVNDCMLDVTNERVKTLKAFLKAGGR